MIVLSLTVWVTLAAIGVSIQKAALGHPGSDGLPSAGGVARVQFLGVLCFLAQGSIGLAACLRPIDAPRGPSKVPLATLIARGLGAGLAIFVAVLLSKTDSFFAGLASAFPAIFLTAMVSTALSGGENLTAGAVGPMMLGGLAPPAYSMIFASLAAPAGIVGAIFLAWAGSVGGTSIPVAFFLRWRRDAVAAQGAAAASVASEGADDAPVDGGVLASPAPAPRGSGAIGGAAAVGGGGVLLSSPPTLPPSFVIALEEHEAEAAPISFAMDEAPAHVGGGAGGTVGSGAGQSGYFGSGEDALATPTPLAGGAPAPALKAAETAVAVAVVAPPATAGAAAWEDPWAAAEGEA
jgi:hypothetical protein